MAFTQNAPANECIPAHLKCMIDSAEARQYASQEFYAAGERCYKDMGKCEKQADGMCGWTPLSPELEECLKDESAYYQKNSP